MLTLRILLSLIPQILTFYYGHISYEVTRNPVSFNLIFCLCSESIYRMIQKELHAFKKSYHSIVVMEHWLPLVAEMRTKTGAKIWRKNKSSWCVIDVRTSLRYRVITPSIFSILSEYVCMFHLHATAVLYQRKFKAGCINQKAS